MTKAELLQTAKPILFNTEMVQAVLDGRKTVTRRVIKQKAAADVLSSPARLENPNVSDKQFINCLCDAPYDTDDVLWVRETWNETIHGFNYKASPLGNSRDNYLRYLWRPAIHMPKEAARLFLRVTNVKVERLQDITEEQAEKEGMTERQKNVLAKEEYWYWFENLWDSTIKKADLDTYGWDANPWVWVIEFERVEEIP